MIERSVPSESGKQTVTVTRTNGRDLVPPWRGEAEFYLEGDEEPSRCFDSNVGMVLQEEGTLGGRQSTATRLWKRL